MLPRFATIASVLAVFLTMHPAVGQQSARPANEPLNEYPDGFEHVEAGVSALDLASRAVETAPGQSGIVMGSALGSFTAPDFFALLTQLSQYWDAQAGGGSGDWINENRVSYTRNDSGFDTELLLESWDLATESWMPDFRRTTTRDENNRGTESLDEEWDPAANGGSGGYLPLQRSTATFNDQGSILVSTSEIWDEDAGDYFIWSRTTYTYDGSGTVVVQRLFESGLFGPLAPSLRYHYEYNGDGSTASIRRESYNSTTATFENSGLDEYTYDSNGEEIENLESDWDPAANGGSGGWVNSFRTTTEFSPNSTNPTSVVETDQTWDMDSGDWVNDERVISELTATNEITVTEQEWDPDAAGKQGAWINVNQSIATLSPDIRPVSVISQVWDTGLGDWVNETRDSVEYDDQGNAVTSLTEAWDGAGWVNQFLLTMTYGEFQSSTAAETDEFATRYELKSSFPNPFTGSTTIGFTLPTAEHVTLEVFDMLGRRVETLVDGSLPAGSHAVRMQADDLPGGVYLYRLSSAQIEISRSMLLIR